MDKTGGLRTMAKNGSELGLQFHKAEAELNWCSLGIHGQFEVCFGMLRCFARCSLLQPFTARTWANLQSFSLQELLW